MGDGSTPQVLTSGATRLLSHSDMGDVMRLKESAGWNQTEQDWERLLELEPEGCFGLELDRAVVATATALTYGRDLAWIGMVLTLPEHRGRGYARRMMECALEYCEHHGVAQAGLDATDMGRPLYEKLGFSPVSVVERWERSSRVESVRRPNEFPAWTPDGELDRAAFGTDRTRLLENLAREGAAAIPGAGYAMGRAGSKAAYFGPCVARSAGTARRLLEWFLARHPGQRAYWDVLAANREAVALAEEHGFQRVRKLTRMIRELRKVGQGSKPDDSLVYATAGFECG